MTSSHVLFIPGVLMVGMATRLPAGHGTTFRSAAVSRTPVGSARAATTTNVRATSTSRTGMRLRVRNTPKLASAAVTTATPTTTM